MKMLEEDIGQVEGCKRVAFGGRVRRVALLPIFFVTHSIVQTVC